MDYKVLRNTPGYTNYVASVKKNITGAISSAELKRYYSAIDAEIYFNGEWIEDIQSINWSVSQQTMPLFGYNSYIWDDVAQGNRIISGSFIINFTAPNNVSDAIKSGAANTTSNTTSTFESEEKYILSNNKITAVSNEGKQYENPVHFNIWESKFDIDVVCGEKENKSGVPVHIILKDCYIIGGAQGRSKDGGVAAEQYEFMARDFVTVQ